MELRDNFVEASEAAEEGVLDAFLRLFSLVARIQWPKGVVVGGSICFRFPALEKEGGKEEAVVLEVVAGRGVVRVGGLPESWGNASVHFAVALSAMLQRLHEQIAGTHKDLFGVEGALLAMVADTEDTSREGME